MNVPYNTGKVLIGRAYVPPPQPMTSQAVQLQRALIHRPKPGWLARLFGRR